MAGIKDIAKKSGYSISTVSYALNNSPKVTAQTRAQILQVAKELKYVPNGAARMLRVRKTKIIGCFLSDYSGSFYGQLLKGIRQTLNHEGYELIVCSGAASRRLLLEKMMDGAIILDVAFSDQDLLYYADLGHKIALLDRELKHDNITTALLDNQLGARLAMQKLLIMKISRLYLVKGPESSYDAKQRLMAARQVASEHGFLEIVEIDGNFTKISGTMAAKQIFTKNCPTQPIGIFCLNDEMAVGFYDYLRNSSWKIGGNLYIVGFDNVELASYLHPKLTTVDYSAARWGQLATQNLLRLLEGSVGIHEKISVTLVKGASC